MPKIPIQQPLTFMMVLIFLAIFASMFYSGSRGTYVQAPGQDTTRVLEYQQSSKESLQIFDIPFTVFNAIRKGMEKSSEVILLVFMAGAAFTVVYETGAPRQGINWMLWRLRRHKRLILPLTCAIFALGGALSNMSEEIIALMIVMLALSRRLGYDPLIAIAMSFGSAAVGAAFSPVNLFQVGIAKIIAKDPLGELPVTPSFGFDGWGLRLVCCMLAVAVWTFCTVRQARKSRIPVDENNSTANNSSLGPRETLVILLLFSTFIVLIAGVIFLHWRFDHLSTLFFALGIFAGLIGGLRITETANAFVEGFKSMVSVAFLIGVARAIYVILDQERILAPFVEWFSNHVAGTNSYLNAILMTGFHAVLHLAVPSVTAQAYLTLPVFFANPLAVKHLAVSPEVTVLTYQYGAGLCDLLTPTSGTLLAILAISGIEYKKWFNFVLPIYIILCCLGLLAIVYGVTYGVK